MNIPWEFLVSMYLIIVSVVTATVVKKDTNTSPNLLEILAGSIVLLVLCTFILHVTLLLFSLV